MIQGKRNHDKAFANEGAVVSDFFHQHFTRTLDRSLVDSLLATNAVQNEPRHIVLEGVGTGFFVQRCEDYDVASREQNLRNFGLNAKLLKNFETLNKQPMSSEQMAMYNVIGRYIDLCASGSKVDCMPLYCLHTMGHVTRTRDLVIKNKQLLQERRERGTLTEADIEKARDQGLSRPKVLILCPMKKDIFQIIENFRLLIFGDSDKPYVSNYRRFKTEFGDTGYRISEKRKVSDDYRKLMNGNIDDCCRIGVAIAKKSLKLYTPFDESDILIASPLGLRMIIGENDAVSQRETDFLASIEVLIIDKADVLLMQNWEHLLNIVGSLHIQPKKLTVDVSRVRQWSLEQLSKIYRQTILISEQRHAECDALFALHCRNYAGLIALRIASQGLLKNIEVPYCQELQRIDVETAENQSDVRFSFFKENVLPKCDLGTVVFIPSYFDFVRIRNYLKNENESFVQLHEYAKEGKVAKARALFYKGGKKLMLLTERFHFYRRYNIKGIKSLIFYQPPAIPAFYHELINMVDSECVYVRLTYTKFDCLRMANIFGDRCMQRIISSTKTAHALVSR